ncbi:unnamed protein product [Oikopleura dioica]|uniref:Uncharacterized protein n=1 Tax=Oikopleura dioica TaxID=34765 RepID=E4Y0G7_OIKDI|nr:unnamed protein product [Oikopleura dioica]CBY42798.1 unnamed protein product [Oikopleura dioica]
MSNQIFFPETFNKEEELSKLEGEMPNQQENAPNGNDSPASSSALIMDIDDDLILDEPSPTADPYPPVFDDPHTDDEIPSEADFQPGHSEPRQQPNQEQDQEPKREPDPDFDMMDVAIYNPECNSEQCANCNRIQTQPRARNRKRNNERQIARESGWRPVGRPLAHESFNEKRNLWNRQEKLPAHKRLPAFNHRLAIRTKFGPLSHNQRKELEAGIKKSDFVLIRIILKTMYNRKQQLTGTLVKKLSHQVLHASYKGKLPLRISNPLPLEIFPRFCRTSIAAISLCDPVRLLEYLNYPSFGYKLNAELSGETLWRRVPPAMRVKCYRKAFEGGAALVKRM